MEAVISNMLKRFESGALTRRELIQEVLSQSHPLDMKCSGRSEMRGYFSRE
jgi:hypothetical protein